MAIPESTPIPPIPNQLLDEAEYLFNIRLNLPNVSYLSKLEQLYEFIDKINQNHVSAFTTCKKGCSGESRCCNMDVQITCIEAAYIQEATGIRANGNFSFTTGHREPCPFLDEDKTCSIYSLRPLLCRTYHVLTDPRNCEVEGKVVEAYGCQQAKMGNEIFKGAIEWIHLVDIDVTGGRLRDIRDYFPAGSSELLLFKQK